MKFKNKTAIITGGASGIGAATVRKMVAQGATVYLTDVQTELGNALAKETGAIFVLRSTVERSC